MSGTVVMAFALLVALLSSAATPVKAREDSALQQLLTKREKMAHRNSRQEPASQAQSAQVERRASLSEGERETVTKQIMQAISEMMNSECMSDRDYQGWVDFGRRDAE